MIVDLSIVGNSIVHISKAHFIRFPETLLSPTRIKQNQANHNRYQYTRKHISIPFRDTQKKITPTNNPQTYHDASGIHDLLSSVLCDDTKICPGTNSTGLVS